jgi:hypothetical protein
VKLQDGVLDVRMKLGEVNPEFWSDYEIVQQLNVSARKMCSEAQSLTSFATFTTEQITLNGVTSFAQEYVLPQDVDQITGAAYFAGVLFPLIPAPREAVQLGGYVGSIPWYFYTKKSTLTLTHQVSPGSITSQPISPAGQAIEPRETMGLYPVPQTELPIYVWYQQFHPQLINPLDELAIPDRFRLGWSAYAVARMKEKIDAFEDAQYYDALHEKETQKFIEYQITNGQEITPPIYSNRPIPPYFLRGANTVMVVAQSPGVTNL